MFRPEEPGDRDSKKPEPRECGRLQVHSQQRCGRGELHRGGQNSL